MISIVIPVFNGGDYLASAIDSALSQDYSNFEVIVVNDGSSDKGVTENIALSYGDNIRYYFKSNGGVASALNFGIKVMKGEYFSWLSHDDLYVSHKLSRQMSILNEFEGGRKMVVYGPAGAFSSDPGVFRLIPLVGDLSSYVRYFLATDSSLHGCTLLIPKSAFMEFGCFNESLRTTQDYDMWFRIAEGYEFIGTNEILVKARQHEAQGTVKMKDVVRKECDELVLGFIERMSLKDISSAGLNEDDAFLKLAKISYRRGLVIAARASLRKVRFYKFGILIGVGLFGEAFNFLRVIRSFLKIERKF